MVKFVSMSFPNVYWIHRRKRRNDRITPHLHDLHWLPVRSRIKYKMLVTRYRALHNEAPAHISEMLTPYNPPRTLRSTNTPVLTVPTETEHSPVLLLGYGMNWQYL